MKVIYISFNEPFQLAFPESSKRLRCLKQSDRHNFYPPFPVIMENTPSLYLPRHSNEYLALSVQRCSNHRRTFDQQSNPLDLDIPKLWKESKAHIAISPHIKEVLLYTERCPIAVRKPSIHFRVCDLVLIEGVQSTRVWLQHTHALCRADCKIIYYLRNASAVFRCFSTQYVMVTLGCSIFEVCYPKKDNAWKEV